MAKKYTSQKSILEAIEKDGIKVIEEIAGDNVLSAYLNNINFMKKVTELENGKKAIAYTNHETAIELLRENGALLEYAKEDLKNDPDAVILAIQSFPDAILMGNSKFLNNLEHALEAVKGNWELLDKVNKTFTKQEKFANAALDQNLAAKEYIDERIIYNNKSIALRLIGENNAALDQNFKNFNKAMRADVEICTKMAESYASKNAKLPKLFLGAARKDAAIALIFIEENYESYKNLHKSLKKNQKVNMAFVTKYPEKVKMIGRQVHKPDVARALVTKNGLYLKNLRKLYLVFEKDVVSPALKQNGAALKYAPKEFHKDIAAVAEAVRSYKGPIPKKGQSQEDAKKLAKNPIKDHPLYVASKKFRKDIGLMDESVENEPLSLKLGAKNIRENEEICLKSVRGNGKSLKYVAKKLQHDDDMVSGALQSPEGYMQALEIVGKKYINNPANEQILIDSLDAHPDLYEKYPAQIQANPQAVLKVAAKNVKAVENLGLEDLQNKAFLRELAKVNTDAYEKAVNKTHKVRTDKTFMEEMNEVMDELKTKQGKTKEKTNKKEKEESKEHGAGPQS